MERPLPNVEGRPLRVLLVAPSLDTIGGQSLQADLILRGFRGDPRFQLDFQPIAPRLPGPLRALQRVRFLRTAPTFALYCAQLRAAMATCDVVHAFSASYLSFVLAPTPAIHLARRLGKPLVLNYHSGEADDHLTRWPSAVRALKLASRLVVPSGYLREVFARHGLAAQVVPNAVDLGRFRFRERPVPAPAFLANRNFEGHYNVALVIRAFARIQARLPEARLTVAGDGTEADALRGLVDSLALRHVRFAGRVQPPDMPALYDAHDVWLNGSDVDNMPLSILEAHASGLAVVSTRAGGIPFLVDDGRTGRLVDCGDEVGLARAALEVVGDPVLFARLAAAGRDECDRYTWDRVGQAWRDTYSALAPPAFRRHASAA